jgi:hypothetical protein
MTPAPDLSAIPSNIAAAVSVLREMQPERLLDLAIAQLRMALPTSVEVPTVQPLRFQLLQVPRIGP